VESGDIGPKLGFNTKDNGYMKFNNFRVPKDALLGRYFEMSPDGTLNKIGN
jgi:acyl-CoA oxidase